MPDGCEPSPNSKKRALIIGKTDPRVERIMYRLAEFFGGVELLTDPGRLKSEADDNIALIVATDTLGDGLNQHFFESLRSLHPRAGLLCLFDRTSRQIEKSMRSAGLLFLGSYEHFDDCYDSVLERAFRTQKAHRYQPCQNPSIPLKSSRTAKRAKVQEA
ncbi:MAG: hypothetical protein JRH12_09805 [Deltaproteobacteria bacterium]|jgi:hypothetical protein|nr:hypothetical protein [Deltaproteobacteria bacterium]